MFVYLLNHFLFNNHVLTDLDLIIMYLQIYLSCTYRFTYHVLTDLLIMYLYNYLACTYRFTYYVLTDLLIMYLHIYLLSTYLFLMYLFFIIYISYTYNLFIMHLNYLATIRNLQCDNYINSV